MIELALVIMWVIGLVIIVFMNYEKTKNTTLNVVSVILILIITTIIVVSLGHN